MSFRLHAEDRDAVMIHGMERVISEYPHLLDRAMLFACGSLKVVWLQAHRMVTIPHPVKRRRRAKAGWCKGDAGLPQHLLAPLRANYCVSWLTWRCPLTLPDPLES